MALTEFFNIIFAPFMAQGPMFAISIVSLMISFTFSALYLVFVDQQKMKRIKAEIKESQEKMKKAQKEHNDKEIKSLFSNSMKLQNEMMKLTLKPIIVSMLLFFIVIPWMYANYGDVSAKIVDGKGILVYGALSENISATNSTFRFSGNTDSKIYDIGNKFEFAGKTWNTSYQSDARGYFEKLRNVPVYGMLTLENARFKLPFRFPGIGDNVGWLGLYIIISIPSTMLFRKILGVD
ncbi:MAG: EMC3/TMCO1 family protein [Nanoarchaeota archaeon]|nr:DUF106 domain-containing protein [Nanoarchaeota archaeon]MBU4300935.1 DUF106 domain-containing protein [Nanoarchaeota archaeon]MBU4451931.1 DUF106 domain-containing protein [Nanoarchaeota archaeon]MCG2723410.1 EMC3/TMCO1 family protein [archaeon]